MKTHDIVIKAGEYQDREGNQKSRWVNIGAVMKNDKGAYLLLDPGINLAAYMQEGRDRVIASLFEAKPRQHAPQQPAGVPPVDPNDKIPF